MKRKIVALAMVLCAIVIACGMAVMFLEHNTTNEVSVPDALRLPIKPTSQQEERWGWTEKTDNSLRWVGDGMFVYTFGQGSKFCDWVVVGTAEKVELMESPSADMDWNGHRVLLSVDSCLYGKRPGKKTVFLIADSVPCFEITDMERRVVQPGDRILAFLTDQWYDTFLFFSNPFTSNLAFFDFDRSKARQEKISEKYVRSYIILDDKETEEEAIRVAKGYLEFFGGKGKRDRDKYVEFLCSLLNSPVQRIRDDAECDLVLFYLKEKDPPPDLDKLLADDRVRKEVKDYLRFRLRNETPNE